MVNGKVVVPKTKNGTEEGQGQFYFIGKGVFW
jgi:hypothetical protein